MRRNRASLPPILGLLLAVTGAAGRTAPALPAAPAQAAETALGDRIRTFLQAPRFAGAAWGIQVADLDTGRVVFEHNAGKYFIPASTTKLFTAALALERLGPDRRLRTSLYAAARPGPDGVLAGDLVLYGRGDPALASPWAGGPFRTDPLEAMAARLKALGVRAVQGDVVGDDSFFTAPPYGPGWEWQDLGYAYGAEPTALTVHAGTVDLWVYPATGAGRPCFLFTQPGQGLFTFRNGTGTGPARPVQAWRMPGEEAIRVTGSLPPGAAPVRLTLSVRDSARFAAQLLARALARNGIRASGQARAVHAGEAPAPLDPAGLTELAWVEGPPVAELVRDLLKRSDNQAAQLLWLQVGAAAGGDPSQDTAQRSAAAMAAWLAEIGQGPEDAVLEDGAGLSRRNLVTPAALVRLLTHMDRRGTAAVFRDSLPVAGVDGTLRRRLAGTPAEGNLRAKTGTLRWTRALAGYLTGGRGERLAFALMLNNYRPAPGASAGEADLDTLAALLADRSLSK
jgi:D-alanyl-D-alanine carboxypeptidase/D-alanyl-D-alanine-endopeptidase (penicillin-binding protein 4)